MTVPIGSRAAPGDPGAGEASDGAQPELRTPRPRHNLLRYVGFAALLLSCLFFGAALALHWSAVEPMIRDRKLLALLCLLVVPAQMGFVFSAIAFHRMLKGMGQPSRFRDVLGILMVSQFAKYLPGNVAHHVGRVVMSRHAGLAPAPVGMAILIELAGPAIVAALIAITFVAIRGGTLPEFYGLARLIPEGAILPALLLGALALALVFALWKWPGYLQALTAPRAQDLAVALGFYLLNFAISGAILLAILSQVAPQIGADYIFLTAAFATAWTIGTITPGAPGGLGVREAVLLALVTPVYGAEATLTAALALRVVTTLTDALGFVLGLALRRWLPA